MKKPLKIALFSIGTLLVIYTIFEQTNMIKMYKNSTTANEPGVMLNSKILVSNLVDYENGDFVSYKYENNMMGEHIRIHRLIGKSGDIVEIKNSILYLNDVNIDENLELKHCYSLNTREYQGLFDKNLIQREDIAYKKNSEVYVFLNDKIAEQNGLASKIKREPKNQSNKIIAETYREQWNQDNFGPLKIPNGKCFVIGDNRHNSEDSRYIGLINEADIVGTVVKK